jgi:hypothetical protein
MRIVIVLHEKGGGARPAHNFMSLCAALKRLSRFVILKYSMDKGNLTPLTQQLDGRLDLVLSFLLVKPHKLLALLNPLCPNPTSTIATLNYGLDILWPTTVFSDIYQDLRRRSRDLVY